MCNGVDELNWLKVEDHILEGFRCSPTVYTKPEWRNGSPSWTEEEIGPRTEMQQEREDNQNVNTVLSFVKNGKQPEFSVLQYLWVIYITMSWFQGGTS